MKVGKWTGPHSSDTQKTPLSPFSPPRQTRGSTKVTVLSLPKEGPELCRRALLLCLIFGLILTSFSCSKGPKPYKETRFMMGTLVDVVLYADEKTASEAAARAFERMREIESLAQATEKGSPLYRIRLGEGAVVEGDLARILATAMSVSRASSGAFDPTLGELVYLWGFGRDQPTLPKAEEIHRALENTGYQKVPEGQCCSAGKKIWFDLGGVAKGYAVDEAVAVLQKNGVNSGIVNAGGDLKTFGARPGRGLWKIGVQDPRNPQELAGILQVKEEAVATSGDYQRFFIKDGVRYHHILNPATGYPAHSGLRGTTVIAPDCATADALATAAFVLGPDKALDLLEGWKGAEGVFITDEKKILTTSGIGEGDIKFEEH